MLRVAFGKLYVGSIPTIGIFLYVAQGDECMLRVAFGKLYVCSSPTIGIFPYETQAFEHVLAVSSGKTQHPPKTDILATGSIGIPNLRSRGAVIWGPHFPPSVTTYYYT